MLHDLACNQFRFTPPILLQMGVFLYPSADDISYSTKKQSTEALCFILEATPRFELGNKGFADLCLTTWLCRHNPCGLKIG